jgi:uncharacterized protein (DUF2237 family)
MIAGPGLDPTKPRDRNVLGGPLERCGVDPMTGFYRDGCCRTGPDDAGRHTICAEMTLEFLEFTRARGNDLITPVPAYGFPGLKNGDRWCVCAVRWLEALEFAVAPPVVLAATHERALEIVPREDLITLAVDMPDDAPEGWIDLNP